MHQDQAAWLQSRRREPNVGFDRPRVVQPVHEEEVEGAVFGAGRRPDDR
jgi:hypothetical protein